MSSPDPSPGAVRRSGPPPTAAGAGAPPLFALAESSGSPRALRLPVQLIPLLSGMLLAVVAVAVVALALGRGDAPTSAAPDRARDRAARAAALPVRLLSADDVQTLIPAIRQRAQQAAGGAVRGPSVRLTATTVHLRLRSGPCRIGLAIARHTAAAQAVAAAAMTLGRGCAGAPGS